MKTLNLKQLQGFFENEIDSRECAHSLTNLIEFSSVLYMIACDGEETNEKVHEYTNPIMADYLADVNSLVKIFLKMKSHDDFSDLEEYLKEENSPLDLSLNLVNFSFEINMLLVLISTSQQTAHMLRLLGSPEFYDSLRLLTTLSWIFGGVKDHDKITAAYENAAKEVQKANLQQQLN